MYSCIYDTFFIIFTSSFSLSPAKFGAPYVFSLEGHDSSTRQTCLNESVCQKLLAEGRDKRERLERTDGWNKKNEKNCPQPARTWHSTSDPYTYVQFHIYMYLYIVQSRVNRKDEGRKRGRKKGRREKEKSVTANQSLPVGFPRRRDCPSEIFSPISSKHPAPPF